MEKKFEHYFTRNPTSKPRYRTLSLVVNGRELTLRTASGLFSPKRIDNATLLLIQNMKLGTDILDLGCGYGAIGISAAVARPEATVTMSDINQRAIEITRENINMNNLHNASVVESDFFKNISKKFDTILMNPPISAGLAPILTAVEDSRSHLTSSGTLQIVARHNKGGSRIQNKMGDVFGNVQTLAKRGGFRVYISHNSTITQ